MKRFLVCLSLLAAPVAAVAHGGLTHVMGTVAKMSATSVNVTTTDGKTALVIVTPATKWMRGQAVITESAVHTGDRVVIHARPVDGKLTAVEVAVGGGAAKH